MRSEKGSVTVFIILIIVPIFLFQAVLIEFARSRLAEQQLETAVKAAMRSVGSLYDDKLQLYGLYGVADPEAAREVFERVVISNVGHGFANTEYIGSDFTLQRSLADPHTFRGQVLEEMKYRAPLEFARQMTHKLQRTGISGAMKDFSSFSDKAKEMDRIAKKRDDAMNQVWRRFDDWDVWISDSLASLKSRVDSLEPEHSRMLDMNVSELRRERSSLEDDRRSLRAKEELSEQDERKLARIEDKLGDIRDELDRYDAWLQELRELQSRYDSIAYNVNEISSNMSESLAQAESFNEQLRTGAEEWTNEFGSEIIRTVRLVPAEDYERVRQRSGRLLDQLHALESSFAALRHNRPESLSASIDSHINNWNDWMKQVVAARDEHKAVLGREEAEKKAAEQEFARQIEQALQMMVGCDPDQEEANRPIYERLRERTGDNGGDEPADGDDYAAGRKADEDAVSLAQMIGQMTERVTESLYVNEYALTSFNYRTFGLEKDQNGAARKQEDYTLSNPASHPLKQQEAEYILYGFHSCAGNYSAAYWEIFAFRLAIRTLESLLSPDNSWRMLGTPLTALLWALAEGAVKAYQDVEKLKDGYEVEISGKLAPAITWNYRDYLRLFLLLHGRQDSYVTRMQALVELNTGTDLSEHYTYWTSRTDGRLKHLLLANLSFEPEVEAAWGYY